MRKAFKWAIEGHDWITLGISDPKPQFSITKFEWFQDFTGTFCTSQLTIVFWKTLSLIPKRNGTFFFIKHKAVSGKIHFSIGDLFTSASIDSLGSAKLNGEFHMKLRATVRLFVYFSIALPWESLKNRLSKSQLCTQCYQYWTFQTKKCHNKAKIAREWYRNTVFHLEPLRHRKLNVNKSKTKILKIYS